MDVIVCGFGNLGFRHVEGLIASEVIKQITIVEINDTTFARNMERVNKLYGYKKNICRVSSLEECPINANLAIVAATADCRAEHLTSLLKLGTQKILLEKVPFNSLAEIKIALLSTKHSNSIVLVNTPRRLYSAYIMVAKLFKNISIQQIKIKGVTDLATNSMHFLDLVDFLSSKKLFKLETIPDNIYDSKRSGFVEFSGKVVATFANNRNELECVLDSSNSHGEIDLTITTDRGIFNVKEKSSQGTILVVGPDKTEYSDKLEMQSALTKQYVLRPELMCQLPSFCDIAKTNTLLLESLPIDTFLSKDNQRYRIT